MHLVVIEADELRRLITEAILDYTGSRPGAEWVDAKNSPLGRRCFLRLAREGAFPSSKVGRKVVARRADVDAYMESCRVTLLTCREPSSTAEPVDPVERALADGRLRLVGKKND